MHILYVDGPVERDERIVYYQRRNILPKTGTNYDKLREIRFDIQSQECYTHPANSTLYIEGKITTTAGDKPTKTRLSNNGVAFLFEEFRFLLNNEEIDRTRNVGISTTMKNYISLGHKDELKMSNTGWNPANSHPVVNADGNFSVSIPLSMIMGFAEDYQRIVFCQQSLVLVRSRSDENSYEMTAAITQANPEEKCEITINNIVWRLPFVKLSDRERLRFYNIIKEKKPIHFSFRCFDLMEYPSLPATSSLIWNVRSTTQLEKPRFVIVGFQTARKNSTSHDASIFDHCDVVDAKLYLNEEVYPYDNLNISFTDNRYAILYDMFKTFQESYYLKKDSQPALSMSDFKSKAPLIVIDCTRQLEQTKPNVVDVRLEIQVKNNFPPNTSAYCLILHDRVFEMDAFKNKLVKL